MIPSGGQAVFQPLKENAAVLHLLDDLEPLGDDLLPFPVGIEPLDGGGHLLLQPRDTGQTLKVVDYVQNKGRGLGACCQCPADLLLINDGRHGGPEQDHARDTFHMDALVQHINAEQQFQVVAIVCLEGCKFFAGFRVAGIGLVDLDIFIHIREPLRHMGRHLVHVFFAGAKHNIFPTRFCDMLCENLVETVGLFQGPAQSFQVFLVGVLDAGAA